ncbi:hypothetical protein [Streptomyces liangshanensis]|uniref:Uncharacterized protein n=1 Tax=Streptomyces liangshanensis TaxID=2717324 RepID=A0A6G9GZG6_9ACTN|nr:hypothetical protein [Streptomyces liangshanensis]QIQ03614.1 hypothetical protein HA039_15895 [Streptomyces liangshanensis]
MSGPARWTVAAVLSVVAFALVLATVRAAPWGWLPKDDGDLWAVGTACGAVVAAAVLYALTWWNSRAAAPPVPAAPGRHVTQDADGRDDAVIEQTVGRRRPSVSGSDTAVGTPPSTPTGTPPGPGSAPVDSFTQRARGRGRSRIRQTGGDDHS